ncbi:MAG: type 1 glutamine amidotransferase [Candidatus Izimaplasma sp.]|nr:type 1 glutamine amidotransferase [Candidatus Izimaplasma bacterium]
MKKIALLIENQYEEKEVLYPYYRMQEEGFQVDLVGTLAKTIYTSKNGVPLKSDVATLDIFEEDYDAVIIPGGFSPDYMRRNQATVHFIKSMNEVKKPIAAICHGPWLMITSCNLKGRKLTGFHTLQKDIENAGAKYINEDVVIDNNFITSRSPKDLPVFARTLIDVLK